jgi:hypothetical protein
MDLGFWRALRVSHHGRGIGSQMVNEKQKLGDSLYRPVRLFYTTWTVF